jgi:DivIVA domain-containing protein
MELSAETIRGVEFRERLRGYHPDDVDAFVETVAVGVEHLHKRLVSADMSDTMLSEETFDDDSPPAISGETVRRTLVMAQRTADFAIAEAEATAKRCVEEAQAEAGRIRADAEEQARAMEAAAEQRARETYAETCSRLEQEIASLDAQRRELEHERDVLEARIEGHRSRLRAALSEQLRSLDETWPDGAPEPSRSELSVPGDAPPVEAEPDQAALRPAGEDRAGLRHVDVLAEEDDDPFLAELRRAVEGPDPWDLEEHSGDAADLTMTAPELRGIPEGGRLTGRLFRRR